MGHLSQPMESLAEDAPAGGRESELPTGATNASLGCLSWSSPQMWHLFHW
ncbi:unnamed protein product [Lepidochelys olivacea]